MYNNIDSRETKPKICILNIPVILKGGRLSCVPFQVSSRIGFVSPVAYFTLHTKSYNFLRI